MAELDNQLRDPQLETDWPDPRSEQTFVVAMNEIYAGREGTGFSANSRYARSYVRKFRARIDPLDPDGELYDDTDVLADKRLPRPFGAYVSNWSGLGKADINALAVDFQAAREFADDWQTWIVTVRYSTDVPPGGPDFRFNFAGTQFGEDLFDEDLPHFRPWIQLPEYEWSAVEATTAKQWDRNGKPFLNSAGQPFAPAPTVEIAYPMLTITRNEETYEPSMVSAWAFAVNAADFMGYPAGCVQHLPPTCKVMWEGGQKYYRVTRKLRFKPEEFIDVFDFDTTVVENQRASWQPAFLDAGYYQLSDPALVGPVSVVPIYRQAHRVSNQPALLNGAGRVLATADPPVYLKYLVYQELDFVTLFANDPEP